MRELPLSLAFVRSAVFTGFAALIATGCAGEGAPIGPGVGGSNGPGVGGAGSPGAAGSTGGSGLTGVAGSGVTGTGGGAPVIPIPPSDLPAENACTTSGSPGPRQLRRLSAAEFTATVRDLFRDPNAPTANIFTDQAILGFTIDSGALLVRDVVGDALRDYAETVASWAATNKLSQIASCTTMDATCRRQVISSFGKRAFRAPLPAARVDAYDQIFAAETTFAAGVEAMISAMLQSPYLLYRTELGPESAGPGATVNLTPHEVASGLSYLLTGSMPDDMLMAAADSAATSGGALALDTHATRLLGDARAQESVMRFASGWLSLDRLSAVKDPAFYTLTDTNRADISGETRAFILDTFASGTLTTLLTANYSFLNQAMAQFYGLPTGGLGQQYTKVTYGGSAMRDPGLLAQAGILAAHATSRTSSPTQRGKLIRTRFLCQALTPPPSNVNTQIDPPMPAQTTREVYELQHINYANTARACPSCHMLTDKIGFGFEHYDGVGKYRATENGKAIDATGTILAPPSGGTVDFDGIAELGSYLAASNDVKRCLVRYWSYYAYGSSTWEQDACTYSAIQAEAAQSNFALKSVVMGIIHAPHFVRRAGDQ
jgi:hypothetical protein